MLLEEEVKLACSAAMSVECPKVESELEFAIVNLEAANTDVCVNSLSFPIMVAALTDNVSRIFSINFKVIK